MRSVRRLAPQSARCSRRPSAEIWLRVLALLYPMVMMVVLLTRCSEWGWQAGVPC